MPAVGRILDRAVHCRAADELEHVPDHDAGAWHHPSRPAATAWQAQREQFAQNLADECDRVLETGVKLTVDCLIVAARKP